MQHSNQIHNPMLYVGLENRSRMKYLNVVRKKTSTLDEIMQAMTVCYGISKYDLFKKSRKRDVVNLRFIFAYNVIEFTAESLSSIGRYMYWRKHDIVIYYKKQYLALYQSDKNFRQFADKFKL